MLFNSKSRVILNVQSTIEMWLLYTLKLRFLPTYSGNDWNKSSIVLQGIPDK
jgi:hypothetical protein